MSLLSLLQVVVVVVVVGIAAVVAVAVIAAVSVAVVVVVAVVIVVAVVVAFLLLSLSVVNDKRYIINIYQKRIGANGATTTTTTTTWRFKKLTILVHNLSNIVSELLCLVTQGNTFDNQVDFEDPWGKYYV